MLVPGEAGTSLALSNLQLTNAGVYTVVAQDSAGVSVTSRVAVLDVDPTDAGAILERLRGIPETIRARMLW